ncbi:hypothetical protein [Lactobacillus delbrueckii]|uniref:hypothetical protein n=1 Tax=Lactobacillus delbrueckii TaxID=1584 RepID=UPI000731E5E7|nr:hypothetical protein [Lactobacillus delbrueckii]ALT48145.1 hypothetical protein AT236_01814 [Lactobacillus delbrueckii subsp. bulgaricus]MCD5464422.1 hypothetical protein [Lactobacillus delbrueckii subsp. bulgaricus]MCD5474660.1 hypothetical protein [Lactobacillus delbrueckii subsp. bulgaricus]
MGIPPVEAAANGTLVVIPGKTSPSRVGFVLVSADWLEGQAFVDLAQVHGAGQLFVKTSNWF